MAVPRTIPTRNAARMAAAMLPILASAAGGEGPALRTRWADDVRPDRVLPEHPRPQLTRDPWVNLNGPWDYAVTPRDAARPEQWDGRILVPFCAESALSGVTRDVGPDRELWYRRDFRRPAVPPDGRLLLHFGAVDWRATVYVNEVIAGTHEGGYDAFTLDVTDAVREGGNELVVRVWDPTDAGFQPRGKQVLEPGGIWYTAVTGIWQTVWLEPVPRTSIRSLRITPDLEDNAVRVDAGIRGDAAGLDLVVDASIGRRRHRAVGSPEDGAVVRPEARIPPWSPAEPNLHGLTVALRDRDGRVIDEVGSYFGMRSIEVRPDDAGVNRLFLNGRPLFQYGTLDQGWWPDGLYTAPTDEALRHDLEVTRRLGFNMVRKHVKVEPARWYYWCDRLGLLVWQDMPSGDRYIHGEMPDIDRTPESAAAFERELRAMIDGLRNHPCVVAWVPYNEGWGQWDTPRIARLVAAEDPTRPVDAASGWTDRGVGDILDIHRYPGPAIPPLAPDRVAALGEFGGLGLPMPGHLWQDTSNWGYRTFATRDELTDAYVQLLRRLHVLVGRGLAAAVYTQTTDVEIEVNGLMTYDRAVVKMNVERAAEAARRLHRPPPKVAAIVPTSAKEAVRWRYVTADPGDGWTAPSFDDSSWPTGRGGFGREGTPGATIGTRWESGDIWLRRSFTLPRVTPDLELLVHHDEDAEVYLNGTLVATLRGYVTDYVAVPLSGDPRSCLREGENVIAVHCRNTVGGQYVDAGLVTVTWPEGP